ncbi:unnamed protein product, partial [Brenthis ino]
MKTIVLFALFVFAAADIEYYTSLNDKLDIEALVSNVTTLKSYMDCFLDRKPCSDILIHYKRITSECMEQACMRCTPSQKNRYWRFLEGVRLLLPEDYENYKKHYDPDNKYFDALLRELSKYKDGVY